MEQNTTTTIKQLVYSSIATQAFNTEQLQQLLQKAREYNQSQQITGMLLYRQACFIQVLEGPANHVDNLYARILTDQRHENLLLLYQSAVKQRYFADWAMAFNADESDQIDGFSDFLHPYRSKHEKQIPEGSVKQLLKRFREVNRR